MIQSILFRHGFSGNTDPTELGRNTVPKELGGISVPKDLARNTVPKELEGNGVSRNFIRSEVSVVGRISNRSCSFALFYLT